MTTNTNAVLAQLRHLYANMMGGEVRDTAQTKRMAQGLLAPAIEALEQAALTTAAAPAAVASPLTKLQRKAIAVCFTSDKVSVSEVQRKLSISYADAQTLCQSIVDLGLTDELELAPSLKQRGAPAPQAAPTSSASVEITDEQMHQGLAAAFAHPRAAAPDAVFKAGVDFGVSVALLQTAPTTQAAPQQEARPVTPYTCPKCNALWLHWPAEQSGFGMDTLNCRSATHCGYCEKGGVEQLQRLERVPAVLKAPVAQGDGAEPVAYLWQHSETGRTRVVMPDAVITADASWRVIGPLFLAARSQAKEGASHD